LTAAADVRGATRESKTPIEYIVRDQVMSGKE